MLLITRLLRRELSNNAVLPIASLLRDQPVDQRVCVQGWVESVRRHKTVTFVQISDRSALFDKLQVVVNDPQMETGDCGAFIRVFGKLVKSRGQKQPIDLLADKVHIIGPTDSRIFLTSSSHSLRDLVEMRKCAHLRPRSDIFRAILSARSKAAQLIHRYYEENGYLLTHPPILTQNCCEDGSEAFRVESLNVESDEKDYKKLGFFGGPTYLTVSTQLHLEALCAGLGKVYAFGPTFRADHSLTRQHLAEFHMIEAEMPFIGDLDQLCPLIEQLVRDFVVKLHEAASRELDLIASGSEDVAKRDVVRSFVVKPFKRLLYSDACEVLLSAKRQFAVPFKRGNDLTKEQELYVVEQMGAPVFLTNHPAAMKPFYMRRTDDEKSALSVDLLLPNVAEVCGGSVREHDLAKLEGRLSKDMRSKLAWYLDLRRVGTFPHAGYGIGFERLVQFSLGLRNIRDTVAFPRFVGSCKF